MNVLLSFDMSFWHIFVIDRETMELNFPTEHIFCLHYLCGGVPSESRKWDWYHLKPPTFPISICINSNFKFQGAVLSMLKHRIQQNQPNHVEIWSFLFSHFVSASWSIWCNRMYSTRIILLQCSTILARPSAFVGRTNFLSREVSEQKFSRFVGNKNREVFRVIPHI